VTPQEALPQVHDTAPAPTARSSERYAKERKGSRNFGEGAILIGLLIVFGRLLALGLIGPRVPIRGRPDDTLYDWISDGLLLACLWTWAYGAIRPRRWARPLAIIGASICLILGSLMTLAVCFSSPTTPPMGWDISLGMTALMALFWIVIPAWFIWFFTRPAVREMLECYDPVRRWTDSCPIPVLGAAIVLAILAALDLYAFPPKPSAASVAEFAAIAFQLGVCIAALVFAWFLFRLRRVGWWGTLGLILLLGYSSSGVFRWTMPAIAICYLLFIRRFFLRRNALVL